MHAGVKAALEGQLVTMMGQVQQVLQTEAEQPLPIAAVPDVSLLGDIVVVVVPIVLAVMWLAWLGGVNGKSQGRLTGNGNHCYCACDGAGEWIG